MFSKRATRALPNLRAWSVKSLSIALKLTLWQATVGFLLLAAATGLLYWTLANSLEWDENQFLAERIEVLVPMLAGNAASPANVTAEIVRESGTRTPSRVYIRLLDGAGRTVGESPGMSEVLPDKLFPKHEVGGATQIEPFDLTSPSGRPFRAATRAVAATNAAGTAGFHTIQIAVDRSAEEALLSTYWNRMVMILLIGLLLFTVTTWFIIGRGLRPVAALTRIVQQVQADRMQARVGPARWPAELTELARSFDQMLDRLERSFQALERFSADIAHELRTPLNILRGEAEVALEHARAPEEYREILESGLEEYQRLTRMVDSLLFLARAEHDTKQIEKKKLDARAEALAVCAFYEVWATELGITIEVMNNAELFADPALLRRALGNLLSNALRHTPTGGAVRISIRDSKASGVEIAVCDTGCGIAKEHLPKLFDRFYRVDAARARDSEGCGLGLAIVKSIMMRHGGAVAIDSELGAGTTVTLTFPSG